MTGYDAFKRKIEALKLALATGKGMSYPSVFGRVMQRDVENSFLSATDPQTNTPWAPRKDNKPHRLLILTGLLESEAVKAAGIVRVSAGKVRAEFTTPFYGKFHQFGTRKMVARRFFGITPEGEQEVRDAVAADIARFMA